MRLRWLTLAATASLMLMTATAHAADYTQYKAQRDRATLIPIDTTQNISAQLPAHAGEIIEIEGSVSGVYSSAEGAGMLLRLPSKEIMIVTYVGPDSDVAIGNDLKVLARIPARGTVLEGVSLTKAGAQTDMAQAADDLTRLSTRIFNTPEEIKPDAATTPETPAAPQWRGETQWVDDTRPMAEQPEIVRLYAKAIKEINARVADDTAQTIAYHLLVKSELHGVDPRLMFALFTQESRFNSRAVSHAGAQGLGQLMPGTARGLGVDDPFDIAQNIDGSVRYLSAQLKAFGKISLALAAYNAGPGRVKRCGGIPEIAETQNYVKRISTHYARLAGLNQ